MFRILFHVFCYDAWFYVTHIILHKYLYNIHKEHHDTPYNKLLYTSTNVAHWFEHALQGLGHFIHPFFVDFYVFEYSIGFAIVVVRGLMRHDDRCSWLMGNHHILHHKYIGYNYGEYWIDNLMGNVYPDKKEYKYGKLYT